MKIRLLCVGKVKERYLQQTIDEYLKRLRSYTSIEYTELKAETRKKTEDDHQVKQREYEKIHRAIRPQDFVIALDEHGTQYSSREFSEYISRYQLRGDVKQVVFVTGGATGFSHEFLQRADHIMSLSKMTFPHQLCRLIFIEQLYRAYTIIAGESYHKV